MARFDIYSNPGKKMESIPFLIEVQSNVISGLASRIVTPLRTLTGFSALALPADLFPIITVNGVDHFPDTPQMALRQYPRSTCHRRDFSAYGRV
ncbi:CcdB family protein [Rugamonas sp.]|uniref:CcdB family protein n=1 Tax=Rugamonas sp. TaxID=1926287 RepID=UPI0025CC66F2|nr:CcdB family protein [Rugamonas sp.]